jgi:hypothetical protein
VKELEDLLEKLNSKRKDYFSKQEQSYKVQESFNSLHSMHEKGLLSLEEIQKASELMVLAQNRAEESLDLYNRNVEMLNSRWEMFESEFSKVFEQFDVNERSRVGFVKRQIRNYISGAQSIYIELAKENPSSPTLQENSAFEAEKDENEISSNSLINKIKQNGLGSSLEPNNLKAKLTAYEEFTNQSKKEM